MNADDIQAAVKKALAVLRETEIDPQSELAAAAFPVLLSALLPTASVSRNSLGPPIGGSPGSETAETITTPLDRAAAWLRIEPERLADFVEFQDGELRIHVSSRQLPSSRADRQRVLAYFFLGLARAGLQKEDIESTALNQALDAYGALDQNVWGNLQKAGGSFSRRGRRGSYAYRLTQPGLEKARETILEHLSGS